MAFILGFIPRLNRGLFAALRGVYPGLFSRYLRCICAGLHGVYKGQKLSEWRL